MSEPTVPTREEISQLPRQAQVAFAARCARRVLTLLAHPWPAAPDEHVLALEGAIRTAERTAANAYVTLSAAAAAVDAAAVDAADARAADAARAAADAARAAARAATNAADAARAATDAVRVPAVTAIRRDFDGLRSLARRDGWTDDTPVPPDVFGPLWPDGPPPKWPPAEPPAAPPDNGLEALRYDFDRDAATPPSPTAPPDTSHVSPLVEVYFPAGELSPGDVQLFLAFLDAVYHKQTGSRLVVVEPRAMEPAEAEVPT